MRDSIANQDNRKAAIANQLKYEFDRKAAADSIKNFEEKKVKDAELVAQRAILKQEKLQRYGLYGGLAIIVIFLFVVLSRFQITKRQKRIIEQQKVMVDEAYKHLHEKNKEVLDSIHYAQKIQRALITPEKYISKNLGRLSNQNKRNSDA
jgi:hypothetical protein